MSFDAKQPPRIGTVRLSNAERADLIIDFSKVDGDEVFLENILLQDQGKRPDDVVAKGIPLVKFVIEGPPVEEDVTVTEGTPLRPHKKILPEEIVATRVFDFDRNGGKWTINSLPYDPHKDDASPLKETAERWILKNPAKGWGAPDSYSPGRISNPEVFLPSGTSTGAIHQGYGETGAR